MKTKILFLILGTFLLFSCSASDSATTQDTTKEQMLTNISYGSSDQQKFDLYLPANRTSETTKIIILIHGGGWVEGDKADMNYLIDIIKQNLPGFAVANMNYRLAAAGNPAFPMQIDDITSVIAKLKSENYSISNKYGFIGVSAGAHLSMLYSYAYNSNNEIKMVASLVGPTNFTDPNYTNDTINPLYDQFYLSLTGQSYTDNPAIFQQISPFWRVTASAPPTILFYGNTDPLVPITQGQDMHTKLDALSVYNEFTLYNGGHGDWVTADQLDAYTKLIAFITNKF